MACEFFACHFHTIRWLKLIASNIPSTTVLANNPATVPFSSVLSSDISLEIFSVESALYAVPPPGLPVDIFGQFASPSPFNDDFSPRLSVSSPHFPPVLCSAFAFPFLHNCPSILLCLFLSSVANLTISTPFTLPSAVFSSLVRVFSTSYASSLATCSLANRYTAL